MEGAPVVILLVGMVFPIALLILALVADVVAIVWAIYTMWHEDWSVSLWQVVRRISYTPRWKVIRHH